MRDVLGALKIIPPYAGLAGEVADTVAAFLPEEWVHVRIRFEADWTKTYYIPHVVPCPKGKCNDRSCYRAGDWLASYDNMRGRRDGR